MFIVQFHAPFHASWEAYHYTFNDGAEATTFAEMLARRFEGANIQVWD